MAGGQKGLSFVGEPMAVAVIATFLITILLQLQLGCLGNGNPSATERLADECDDAYVAANDEDPETTVANPGILQTPDCIVHVQDVKRAAERERAEEMEEPLP